MPCSTEIFTSEVLGSRMFSTSSLVTISHVGGLDKVVVLSHGAERVATVATQVGPSYRLHCVSGPGVHLDLGCRQGESACAARLIPPLPQGSQMQVFRRSGSAWWSEMADCAQQHLAILPTVRPRRWQLKTRNICLFLVRDQTQDFFVCKCNLQVFGHCPFHNPIHYRIFIRTPSSQWPPC